MIFWEEVRQLGRPHAKLLDFAVGFTSASFNVARMDLKSLKPSKVKTNFHAHRNTETKLIPPTGVEGYDRWH